MAATIREVARQAEVSIATVSRALNRPHLVAEDTRSRVVDTALRLGYPSRRPRSAGAAAPPSASPAGRVGFVGAVLPDLANPFYPAVLYGMRSESVPAGQHVLSLDAAEDPAAGPGEPPGATDAAPTIPCAPADSGPAGSGA